MSPRLAAVDSQSEPEKPFKDNLMARLWESAPDRDTGADAVVAIRTRLQQPAQRGSKHSGRVKRFLLGR
jgi:hypothetical protein